MLSGRQTEGKVDLPSPAVTAQAGRELRAPAAPFEPECCAPLSSTDLKTEGHAQLREKEKARSLWDLDVRKQKSDKLIRGIYCYSKTRHREGFQ